MLYLSEILIAHYELESFSALKPVVARYAKETGETFFKMDVMPPFPDTPENWEDVLEAVFTSP
jgi:hypothetical protein